MDDIAARVPADGVAKRVTSKGYEYTPDKTINQLPVLAPTKSRADAVLRRISPFS